MGSSELQWTDTHQIYLNLKVHNDIKTKIKKKFPWLLLDISRKILHYVENLSNERNWDIYHSKIVDNRKILSVEVFQLITEGKIEL